MHLALIEEKANESYEDVAKLVKLISEIGPNIAEISRRLGEFKETVRYRYKKQLIDKDFAIQAIVNHEFLGLKRIVFVAQFPEYMNSFITPILSSMNELCYVVGFEKMLLEDKWIVNASVPAEYIDNYVDFLITLKGMGLFESISLYQFEWFRIVPMKAEKYNFETGRWDLDLKATPSYDAVSYNPTPKGEFDYTDLLILKELHMDATQTLKEISEKIGVNYKKMAWHYLNHIRPSGMIKGYILNWMGTKYDYAIERALHRKHRYLRTDILARDLSDSEKLELASKVSILPFVWAEALGKDYWVQIAIPVDYLVEVLQFLGETLSSIGERVKLYFMDQTNALAFTVSYKLFDSQANRWKFEPTELIPKFESLLIKIKESTVLT
jgi:DNA-binding Lrp family transcriptional regulator